MISSIRYAEFRGMFWKVYQLRAIPFAPIQFVRTSLVMRLFPDLLFRERGAHYVYEHVPWLAEGF